MRDQAPFGIRTDHDVFDARDQIHKLPPQPKK
jgi:hypothetical protein